MPHLQPSWPWWRCAIAGLSALGLTLSGYLGWHYLAGGSVLGCDGGSACDQVLSSRWSVIGGVVPVSGLAAGVYLALLLAGFYLGPDTEAPVRRLAWQAMLVLAGAAAGSAAWFTVVQKWMIGAFCPYCMATHLTSVVLAALVIWRVPRRPTGIDPAKPAPAPNQGTAAKAVTGLALVGLTLAGLMAAAQVAFAPRAVYQAGESTGPHLIAVDPQTMPVLGSPDAPYVIALLFDYNCPHCQRLHAMLDAVMSRYGGKVAFALCPVPLNPRCNPYIPQEEAAFKDSCELARIALAVWTARRDAFAEFDRWMFGPEPGEVWHPRSPDAARAKAIALVGQAGFAAGQADPGIERQLQTGIRLFGATGANAVPKLVFGSRWVNQAPDEAAELVEVLKTSLKLPPP